ncbi:dTDP-4-dehydrorhamnose 3,5-epimerase [Amycolatopsis sp.]|uniref:dTDP-4-dehydrorhamnose 3,5-epimerase family protein n=1 Tax=Amycolatopsis sp. TaxID=37632 RepID=UPI002D05FBC0|nr:dTDP-4-dehydrorhamnose 3,5-epimerase [Amycolatopsis sp.]HVV10873.1 dTDP-4-dehydrorhamnose 3,5-epimerase [Amycolatopsis sp.]
MQVRELAVLDAYEFSPPKFPDHRGLFVAPFQEQAVTETLGHRLRLGQTNHSVSRRGTIRGVHFADTPPGQAKYVYCPRGALLDVIVDLRVGSPTFGKWDAVRLDSQDFHAVYVAEGLGHAFVALEEDTAMSYLCSTGYNPGAEHGITPLDPELDLPWPDGVPPILSEKDTAAPTLAQALESGLLPDYNACLAHYKALRDELT